MKLFKNLLAGALSLFVISSANAGDMKDAKIALNGHCAVCYISAGKAVKGSQEFKASHKGKSYLFVSQDALNAFKADPAKFMPAYGGNCAICMAKGKTVATSGDAFIVHDGRIYLNKDEKLNEMFKADAEVNIKAANKNWKAVRMERKKMKMEKEKMKKEKMEKEKMEKEKMKK